MKIIVVLLTAFTLVSCKLIEVSKYEYHTTTMMGRTVLSITQDSVIVTFNGVRLQRGTQELRKLLNGLQLTGA